MNHETETALPEPQRTPSAYRRDLLQARQVIAQLRGQAMEAGEPFHAGASPWTLRTSMPCGTAWTGWTSTSGKEESFRRYMESRLEARPTCTQRPWWRFWIPG